MTPIIYPFLFVGNRLAAKGMPQWLFLLNPLTPIVLTFQRAIYNRTEVIDTNDPAKKNIIKMLPDVGVAYHLISLTVLLAISTVFLVLAMKLFRRLEGNFAEEL
jgi:ABC-2 type transport system permease protein